MSVGERIKNLRGKTTVAEFCRTFSIHRNTLPRYESGERVPDANFLSSICLNYQVNAEWLLLGTGPKKQGDLPTAELDQSILTDAIEALESALHEKGRVMEAATKAEIITEIYLLMSEEGQADNRSNIAKILRLVA